MRKTGLNLSKKFRASRSELRRNSNTLPWYFEVPDLMTRLMVPPAAVAVTGVGGRCFHTELLDGFDWGIDNDAQRAMIQIVADAIH
jgi:hypothetical protein